MLDGDMISAHPTFALLGQLVDVDRGPGYAGPERYLTGWRLASARYVELADRACWVLWLRHLRHGDRYVELVEGGEHSVSRTPARQQWAPGLPV